jgi:urease accessory protein
VGSGKTALVEALVPMAIARGHRPAVVANDVFTQEDALIMRRSLAGILDEGHIVGVETGTCPHTAVREDPSLNLAAIDELMELYPDIDVVFVESGGDNLTLTFSPILADVSIYVLDVAGGDKMPRKQGPGMIQSDLLVINKADLAPYVGADLGRMERDTRAVRPGPFFFTDCRHGDGLDEVAAWLEEAFSRPRQRSAVHEVAHWH